MKEIRQIIAIEEGKYDTNYTLVRTESGRVYVETFESPNKPFQTGMRGPDILPEQFDAHTIDGRSLLDIVESAIQRADSEIY